MYRPVAPPDSKQNALVWPWLCGFDFDILGEAVYGRGWVGGGGAPQGDWGAFFFFFVVVVVVVVAAAASGVLRVLLRTLDLGPRSGDQCS